MDIRDLEQRIALTLEEHNNREDKVYLGNQYEEKICLIDYGTTNVGISLFFGDKKGNWDHFVNAFHKSLLTIIIEEGE